MFLTVPKMRESALQSLSWIRHWRSILVVHWQSELTCRPYFFVVVNGGVVLLEIRIHVVKDVDVGGPVGGVVVDEAIRAVFITVEVNFLEEIGDMIAEDRGIVVQGSAVDGR